MLRPLETLVGLELENRQIRRQQIEGRKEHPKRNPIYTSFVTRSKKAEKHLWMRQMLEQEGMWWMLGEACCSSCPVGIPSLPFVQNEDAPGSRKKLAWVLMFSGLDAGFSVAAQ
jgi:hypothetical protein